VSNARIASLLAVALLGLAEFYVLAIRAPERAVATPQHRIELPAFGAGRPVTQSFMPGGDGLDEVTFVLTSRRPCQGQLSWTLFDNAGGSWARVLGTERPLALTAGEQPHVLRFPPVERSAGRTYRLDLQFRSPAPCDAAIVASQEDAYPGGYLTVDGVEQWGDLAFDARAEGDTIAGRVALTVLPALPGVLSSDYLWFGVALLITLAAGYVAGTAFASGSALSRVAVPRARALSAILWLVLAGALTATVAARPHADSIDLLDTLYQARLEPTPAGLHWSLHTTRVSLGGISHAALFAHARSRVTWSIAVRSHMHLRGAMAIHPGAWNFSTGDGVYFRVSAVDDGREVDVFGQFVDPVHVPDDRRWVPLDVNLSRFSGRTIELRLTTEPSAPGAPENPAYDWALWGDPRVEIAR
jgi:hypothetical protein